MSRNPGPVTGDKTRFVGLRITQKQYDYLLWLSKQYDYPENISEAIRTIIDEHQVPPEHRYRFAQYQVRQVTRLVKRLQYILKPLEPDLLGDLISQDMADYPRKRQDQ